MTITYSPETLSLAMEMVLTDSRGVALCDKAGKVTYSNALFQSLKLPKTNELIQQLFGLENVSFDHQLPNRSIRIRIHKMIDGFAIIAEDSQSRFCAKEQIIRDFSAPNTGSLFDIAVKSIAQASGWRWVAISRFIDNHTVEILSMYDHKQKVDNYVFDLMGTPCETVARTKQFAFFPNLNARFPFNTSLTEMGAKVYAGAVYQSNNVPIGHIFAMHDHLDIDASLIEDVLLLSTSIMGYKLEAEHAKNIAHDALNKAHYDALTQILNRRAFNRDIETCVSFAKQKKLSDTLLGIIDLDGMKQINDQQGHETGDKLLKIFSESLTGCSRPEDKLYRVGGDEFAMILNGVGLSQVDSIIFRINNAIKKTQQAGFSSIDASVGFASLSEINEDASAWFQLADERMYKHKKSKITD